MSTSIKLPSGQQVTRYWNGHGFLYMFTGTDATIDHGDLVALAATWLTDDRADPDPNACAACTFVLEFVSKLGLKLAPAPGRYPVTVHHDCPSCGRSWELRCEPGQ